MSDTTLQSFCANHPSVETSLRCNKCEKPICAKCAVLTPTGYRCKECIKEQQKIFDTAIWYDYLLIFVVVFALAYLGSRISLWIGFFTIFLAPIAGGLIAEAARLVTRRRRSRYLFILAGVAAVLGCIPVIIIFIQLHNVVSLRFLYQIIYTVLMTSTMFYRLSGIRIG